MTALEEWLSLANKLNEQTALLWAQLEKCKVATSEWKVAADIVGERLIATELKLEKCEAELKKQAQDHLHYINGHQQIEEELKERLERCEAALRPFIDPHKCPLCDAARAALEAK